MSGLIIFGFFTLFHGVVALASLALLDVIFWPALCLFFVEAVTAFDNGVTVVGKSVGIGRMLLRLNRFRFLLHATCIGLLVPVYGGIGVELAFSSAATPILIFLCWLLGIAISVYGYVYQYRGLGLLMPVNYFGCLRYAQSVREDTRWDGHEYSEEELNNKAIPPLASIVTTLIGLIIAFFIGWAGAFWLLFIVSALMMTAGLFPQRRWAPVATSGLEIVFSSGLLYSLWYAAQVPT